MSRTRLSRYGLSLTLGLLTLAAPSLMAAVKYVDSQAGGANDGSSWANAYTDLKAAIAASASGTDLWIAQGIYRPGTTSADTFTMKTGVNLYGGFTNGMTSLAERDWMHYRTILSGDVGVPGDSSDNSYHILTAVGNEILDGLTFEDGNASVNDANPNGIGSAIIQTAGTGARILNCLFARNQSKGSANADGTIYTSRASTLVSNCVFLANNADYAIVFFSASSCSVINSLFLKNSFNGTSAYVVNTPSGQNGTWVDRCTFVGNQGRPVGKYHNGFTSIRGCIFWDNVNNTLDSARYRVSYSDIQGCGASTNWLLTAVDDGGNLDVDPKFVAGPTGTWSQAAVYDAALDQTFYTTADAEPALTENSLNGRFLTPAWDS